MPYIAIDPHRYEGISVGDGQCVAFVRAASNAPPSSAWTRGAQVKSTNYISTGTVIATFGSSGKYGNRKDGTSHAAIFLRKTPTGIVVLDQWVWMGGAKQVVHERTIHFGRVAGQAVNNGDNYYVVE